MANIFVKKADIQNDVQLRPTKRKNIDQKRLGSSNLTRRQKLLLFAICGTYVSAVPLRQFLSSINPDLKEDENIKFTNELSGYIIQYIEFTRQNCGILTVISLQFYIVTSRQITN